MKYRRNISSNSSSIHEELVHISIEINQIGA